MPHDPTPHGMSTKYLILLLIATVSIVAIVGVGYVYIQKYVAKDRDVPSIVASSMENALQGESSESLRLARETFDSLDSADPYRAWAGSILADTLLTSAATPADVAAAVRVMKASLNATQSPYARAVVLNRITGAMVENRSEVVYGEVFRDEPLASLREQEWQTSFNNLVGLSLSTFPTFDAYMLFARSAADGILVRLRAGTNEPISDTAEVAEKLHELVSLVDKYSALALSRASYDRSVASSSPYAVTIGPWQDFWTGHVLGVAARVEPAYLSRAEDALERAASAYDTVRGASGERYEVLANIQAKAVLSHARLISSVSGSTREGDIRRYLDTFTMLVTGDPAQFAAFYRFFDGVKNDVQPGNPEQGSGSASRLHAEYIGLASYSPRFASFLRAQGWDF